MNASLGIQYTEIGEQFLMARMPVDSRTVQPMKRLNGGASLALIETTGSMAANLTLNRKTHAAVGQQVHAHHFRPAMSGDVVFAKAVPLHLGKKSQVWEVTITNSGNDLICKGTITMAIIDIPNEP